MGNLRQIALSYKMAIDTDEGKFWLGDTAGGMPPAEAYAQTAQGQWQTKTGDLPTKAQFVPPPLKRKPTPGRLRPFLLLQICSPVRSIRRGSWADLMPPDIGGTIPQRAPLRRAGRLRRQQLDQFWMVVVRPGSDHSEKSVSSTKTKSRTVPGLRSLPTPSADGGGAVIGGDLVRQTCPPGTLSRDLFPGPMAWDNSLIPRHGARPRTVPSNSIRKINFQRHQYLFLRRPCRNRKTGASLESLLAQGLRAACEATGIVRMDGTIGLLSCFS